MQAASETHKRTCPVASFEAFIHNHPHTTLTDTPKTKPNQSVLFQLKASQPVSPLPLPIPPPGEKKQSDQPTAPKTKNPPTNTKTLNSAEMCQYTRGTTHECGHPRTGPLVVRCEKSWETGKKCERFPMPHCIKGSLCYDCEEAHFGRRPLNSLFLSEQLALPETSETAAKYVFASS